ncbi:uncharacterized protein LOC106442065 [Brassica napus]|uniref:uncharacterized protein LOC106442065 n=1 Tax=Brassica napus TaxID=3708 RepID=UPI0006AB3C71|nr:uncharacterized protein LOC106442065 [Brassica napus]
MWIANYDRLPTRSRLAAWGLHISPTCPLCSRSDETMDHLLLSCDYSQEGGSFSMSATTKYAHKLGGAIVLDQRSTVEQDRSIKETSDPNCGLPPLEAEEQSHSQPDINPGCCCFRGIDKEIRNIISGRRQRKKFVPSWPCG